ncbi:MAG: tetratricopeptide repeat protein, partial [Verrucomicrobia bacterium]|nr:tetratricopeptide repeat protein [Verrucomicrobiota bacterium]
MDETNIPERIDRIHKNGLLYQKEIEYDELTELFSIAASPDIQIDSLISYMSENQDKFADNDWVNIFHGLLFDRNYLQQAFENPEKKQFLATRMREFFNPLIENAVQLEDFATAANAIWFAKSAQNFLGEPSIITCETIVKVFEQGIAPKFVASRPVLLETILACCKDQFLQPATTEAEQKLLAFGAVANLFSLSNPTGTSSSCIPRMQEARNAAFGLRTAISTGNSDDIYNAFTRYGAPFIAKMQPQLKDASLLQQSDDTFTLRNSQTGASYGKIALSSGTYVPEDKSQLHIYDKELSQEIIQLLKTEDVGLEEVQNYRCFIEGGTVHIRDPKTGTELRILKKDKQIYIATEIDGQKEWLLHLHPKTSFTNHELTHGFHQRLGNNNRFYLVDLKTQKPVFTLQQNGFSNEKHFVSNPPEENFFSRFEDPTCTIFLADNQTNSMQRNAIQEVQFPRLGLTLKMENGKWQLQEQPEWHVAKPEEQFVPHFGPKTGFLVVQNSVGAKRVLIPVWNPTETPEDKKSLNSSYSYEFNGETARKGRFVECSLKNDTITPDSLEARFQLARIYLETGNIDEAEALLFSHTAELTHKKLTDNEIEILTAIATGDTSGDIGSRTLRTRMRALYLLEKNSYQFGKSGIDESNRKKMVDLIEAYLGRLSHLRPLPQAAEYFLLAPLAKDSAKIRLRVSELQPEDEFSNRFEPEVGGAFTILENGVGNIPDKRPTIRTRLRYLTARMGNTFPFDPTTVKSYELEPYMRLIRDEALRYLSKGWDAAIKRGFMQGITV